MIHVRFNSIARGLAGASVLLAFHVPVAWAQAADHAIASSGQVSVSSQEVQTLVSALSPAQREQLSKNPAVLEQWIRARLADKLLLQEAVAQQWGKRPEIARQIEKARQEVIARPYLASVSKVSSDYPSDAEVPALGPARLRPNASQRTRGSCA